jgi:pimeloyl-ACP methyl ester carboxylesterase
LNPGAPIERVVFSNSRGLRLAATCAARVRAARCCDDRSRLRAARRRVEVDASLLRAFAEIDQRELLKGVRCPALLVCGDGDDEEREILAQARRALPLLPAGSRLEVTAGAPHGFGDQDQAVINAFSSFDPLLARASAAE